jgi:hypothetical protein
VFGASSAQAEQMNGFPGAAMPERGGAAVRKWRNSVQEPLFTPQGSLVQSQPRPPPYVPVYPGIFASAAKMLDEPALVFLRRDESALDHVEYPQKQSDALRSPIAQTTVWLVRRGPWTL